ncbi:MAG: OmpA family protein, partial [Bacteroidia bacterium]|nr:OmpA family protein [Bacteroidia bacterium]
IKEGSDSKAKEQAMERLANCYRIIGNFEKAEELYRTLIKKNKSNADYLLRYALSLKASAKYAEAYEEFTKYIALKPSDPMGKVYLESCQLAQKWLDENNESEVRHPEQLNTPYPEFAPTFYKDGFIFCGSREDSKRPFIDFDGGNSEPKLDFYYVDLKKSCDTLKVEKFEDAALNTPLHEGPATFSPGFDTIYFTRTGKGSRDFKKNIRYKTLSIFRSVRTTKGWTVAKDAFKYNSNRYSVMHPSISPDGKFMIFASDMPGGQGGTDLYITYLEGKNGWSVPVNIGAIINTFGNELYPFVYDDHTLYFSSDAHPGMGKLDIFVSYYKDGEWAKPANLKPPFNSIGDDFGFVKDKKTKSGFLSSDRLDTKGRDDIYAFTNFDPTFISIEGPKIRIQNTSMFDGLKYKVQNKELNVNEEMACNDGYFEYTPIPDKNYTISIRKDGFSYSKIDFILKRNTNEDYLYWEIKTSKKPVRIAGKLTEPCDNSKDSIKTECPVGSNYVLLKHDNNTLAQTATDINGNFIFKEVLEAKKTYEVISKKGGKAQPYKLSGQVLCENIPIPETNIVLLKDGLPLEQLTTDALGYFSFSNLTPANEYTLVSNKDGYLKSLTNLTSEDFFNAENRVIFKNIEKKKLTAQLSRELAKSINNQNTITQKPEKSFELIVKLTEKNKPLADINIKLYENGSLLTEATTNFNGDVGYRHLDKTKNYTLVSQIKEGKENIFLLDTNEYRPATINLVTKQIDIASNKPATAINDKLLKKINKTQLYNSSDSIYYMHHLKIIRGYIENNGVLLANTEIEVKVNGELIEKIKTNETGNYYYDKLNETFNYEFIIQNKLLGSPKFSVFREEIKNTPTQDLVRNVILKNGIAIQEHVVSDRLANLKIHFEGYTEKEKLTIKLFENGHQRAEVFADENNSVVFGKINPNKSYNIIALSATKELLIAPIPAQSNFFTVGDTLYINKGLTENKLEGEKIDIPSANKAIASINKNGKAIAGATIKLYVNGQLTEEIKTTENGRFTLSKINTKQINSIQFIDKNGELAMVDLTETDIKEMIAGRKVFEFYDPELNNHHIAKGHLTTTSAIALFIEKPITNNTVQIFENGVLYQNLKTSADGLTTIKFLSPEKTYTAKTKIDGKEFMVGINPEKFYSEQPSKIIFSKSSVENNAAMQPQKGTQATASLYPISGKLLNNGKPIANTELRIYEKGSLKDVIETDGEGNYLFTNLNPKNNNKVEVMSASGKIDLMVSSDVNNTNTPVTNLRTEVTKTNLISNDNIESALNDNIKNLAKASAESEPVIDKNSYNDKALIKGVVMFNGVPAAGVSVKINYQNKTIEKLTNTEGKFSFENIKESGDYEIQFSKTDYKNEKIKLTKADFATDKPQNIKQVISLQNPIMYNGSVSANEKTVPNSTVALIQDHRIVGKAVSDNEGKFAFQMEQGKEYTVKASSKDYFNNEAYVSTIDKKQNTSVDGNVKMNVIETNKTIRLDNIYYDFNSANIRMESLPELEKLVDFMTLNPKVKIEVRAHTDLRGDDNYNMKLSVERARNVMLFLMLEDIEKGRIIYKGFGETMPLIQDAQTEEEHQYNRRTEFIVLEK